MKSFLSRFRELILFTLTGFDRLRLCGESRLLNHVGGVNSYLYQQRVPFKGYSEHAEKLTRRFLDESRQQAGDVPYRYLPSSSTDKEAVALELAHRHGRTQGRIALIACQESARTYRARGVGKDENGKRLLGLVEEQTRCLHHYHYFLHERFGLCYVRIGSWFPFSVRVGLNGRRWLGQELRNRGVGCTLRDNLITHVDDAALAQQLLDEQAGIDWPAQMRDLVRPVHPLWDYLHDDAVSTPYYWMAEQTEWATDFLFRNRDDLTRLYPRFLDHCIRTLDCKDVLRFLGRKVPEKGYGTCSGEAKIDYRTRNEGTRIKFWYDTNSLKMYDKGAVSPTLGGIALRLECTINQPKGYKVFRLKEGAGEDAQPSWQDLRKGVADLPRRAEVSQAAVNRLADSLAKAEEKVPLGKLLEPLGRPVFDAQGRRRARPLNPLTGQDGDVLRWIAKGDFLINGFRNRDLRHAQYGESSDPVERRRQAGKVTRLLALLRAHDLIQKVQKTHRYQLTAQGRRVTAALSAVHEMSIEQLAAA